ncbi:hypothetical protein MRX96_036482 [Rhipicephalus microplus]
MSARTSSSAVAVEGVDLDVSRHHGGDLFRDCGGCGPDAWQAPGGDNDECRCQCAPSHHTYREDIRTCVRDLGECRLGAFVRPGAPMEQIPLVFLPLAGQIVHPGGPPQPDGTLLQKQERKVLRANARNGGRRDNAVGERDLDENTEAG